MASVIS